MNASHPAHRPVCARPIHVAGCRCARNLDQARYLQRRLIVFVMIGFEQTSDVGRSRVRRLYSGKPECRAGMIWSLAAGVGLSSHGSESLCARLTRLC
jgi:hypothetical protein